MWASKRLGMSILLQIRTSSGPVCYHWHDDDPRKQLQVVRVIRGLGATATLMCAWERGRQTDRQTDRERERLLYMPATYEIKFTKGFKTHCDTTILDSSQDSSQLLVIRKAIEGTERSIWTNKLPCFQGPTFVVNVMVVHAFLNYRTWSRKLGMPILSADLLQQLDTKIHQKRKLTLIVAMIQGQKTWADSRFREDPGKSQIITFKWEQRLTQKRFLSEYASWRYEREMSLSAHLPDEIAQMHWLLLQF